MNQTYVSRSAFDSWPLARPSLRISAFLVDSLLVAALTLVVVKILGISSHPLSLLLFWWIGMWFWELATTTLFLNSPGRKLFKLELYSPRLDGPPNPSQVSIRVIVFWISLILLGIGILPILNRRDHRGWHDLIAETLVLGKTRSQPNPKWEKLITSIVLLLSLVLFSGIGARIFSYAIHYTKNDQNLEFCNSVNLWIQKTDQALFASLISPAWRSCKPAIDLALTSISDSKLNQLIPLTMNYQSMSQLSLEEQEAFYQTNILPQEVALCQNSSKECNTAIYLKGLWRKEDIQIADHWLKAQEKEVSSFFKTGAYESSDYWKAQAYKELSTATGTIKNIKTIKESTNPTWLFSQKCMASYFEDAEDGNCERFYRVFSAVEELKSGNTAPLEDFIATSVRDFVYFEALKIKLVLDQKADVSAEILAEIKANTPKSNLLYRLL